MSFQFRTSGLAFLLSILSTALMGVMGLSANAQTAPQLLPYTSKLLAGGGTTATFTVGQTCPVAGAGFTATDVYGDGCLATEIQLTGPRYAAVDKTGTVFVSDYTNGLIRRIDPISGIITAVAGGAASSPAKGTACGTNLSVDTIGDGCLSTAVKLGKPGAIVFDATGNMYFSDPYNYNVRKIAATAGVIPTGGGIITLIDGDNGGTSVTYGYAANNASANVVAASAGYLDGPYGLAIDTAGNLYIAEEYKEAVLVVNTNTTGSTTVTGVTIPAGTVAKIQGYATTGGSTCPNSPATTNGCNYGLWVDGTPANSSESDAPWGVALGLNGGVYFANEYNQNIGLINSAGILKTVVGIQGTLGKGLSNTKRALAGSFAIGASLGLASDSLGNLYVPDETNGFVWRVDAATGYMYVVAGGSATPCAASTDTFGDGCPGLQSNFSGTGTYGNNTTLGLYGDFVDQYADLFVGDAKNNLVREVASGTQFGVVGANQPTNIVDIHFGAGDTPASSGAYSLIAGTSDFSLGTATCTLNTVDNTTDCLLPVTATPTALGLFSNLLTVVSTLGQTGTFPLSGNYVQSPITRTTLTASAGTTCSGSTVYATTASIKLTATISANGPAPPTGTVVFKSNGVALAPTTGVSIVNTGTTSSPIYQAILNYTFSTVGPYSVTATYSGDSYFKTSTSTAATFSTALPGYSFTQTANSNASVAAGATALYGFNVPLSVYTGTIAFSCSGLPAGAACVFSPSSIVGTGCSTPTGAPDVVGLSITTTQGQTVQAGGFGAERGPWQLLGMVSGLALALMIGIRRRKMGMRYGQVWMALALLLAASGVLACGKTVGSVLVSATPNGNYTVTVTATGTSGTPVSLFVPLTVATPSHTTLSTSANPSAYASPVTFTAQVTQGYNGGGMVFTDGGTTLATVPMVGSTATYTPTAVTPLAPFALHSITATYVPATTQGSAPTLGSSATLAEIITTPTVTTIASSANPSVAGNTVKLTIAVATPQGFTPAGFIPTGTVFLYDGGTLLGIYPLNASGQYIYTSQALTSGTHTFTANYYQTQVTAIGSTGTLSQVVQ